MNKHSFLTERNITFTYCSILVSELVGWIISEHCPSHSSRTMITERSQVHALQSKHNPTVGGNSRFLSVWACQTQKPRLVEPSSVPLRSTSTRVWVGLKWLNLQGVCGGGCFGSRWRSSEELQGKFRLINTYERETGYIKNLKKDWETRKKRSGFTEWLLAESEL